MHVNKGKMAIALIFGLCAFCAIYFKVYVPIVGTHIVMDPSEVFVTLGAAFPEVLLTMFITTAVLFFLPPKYRKEQV